MLKAVASALAPARGLALIGGGAVVAGGHSPPPHDGVEGHHALSPQL